MIDDHDYSNPRYKAWRLAVFRRDHFRCQMPGCNRKNLKLNAHHIRCWSTYPGLRYEVGNGITLCRGCHFGIRGKEPEYEAVFLRSIANRNKSGSDIALRLMMERYKKDDRDNSLSSDS